MLVLPQNALEQLLSRRLAAKGVPVRWSHRLARLEPRAQGVVATVQRLEKQSTGYAVAHTEWAVEETFEVDASFVIGADGHRSLVRRALGLRVRRGRGVAGVRRPRVRRLGGLRPTSCGSWSTPARRAPCGRCPADARAGAWSSTRRRWRRRTASRAGSRPSWENASSTTCDEAAISALLRRRAPWFSPEPHDLRWSIEVRFERRLAAQFGRGRVWLAGDAAHLTGPAGMQSMNAGLDEASDLAAKLVQVRSDGGDDLAARGVRPRAGRAWRFLLGLDGGLTPGAATPAFVAENAQRLLSCLPATGDELEALLAQLGLTVE